MRHLWSFLAGLVAAPLAWLLLATGQYRSSRTVAKWNAESFFDTADLIGPAAFVAAAGVLLGLIGTLRLSPVGPLVAGLLLVAPTVFMFINPFETLDAFSVDRPRRLLDQDLQPWLPVENGTLLVLGALLLMAVFSAKRWRRWPATAAVLPPAAVTEQPPSQPMSDEEILAAAAELEREEQATADASAEEPAQPERAPAAPAAAATASPESTAPDPAPRPSPAPAAEATPERPAEPEPEPEPMPASEPQRGAEAGTRSGASGTG